jgi:hypothetical protein
MARPAKEPFMRSMSTSSVLDLVRTGAEATPQAPLGCNPLPSLKEGQSSALSRHKQHHLGPLVLQAKQAADQAAGQDVLSAALDKLDAIEAEAKRLAAAAEAKGQFAVAGNLLVREAVRLVELSGRLRGLLQANPAVQVGVAIDVSSPQFQKAVEQAADAQVLWLLGQLPSDLRTAVGDWLKQVREARLAAEMTAIRVERAALDFTPAPPGSHN